MFRMAAELANQFVTTRRYIDFFEGGVGKNTFVGNVALTFLIRRMDFRITVAQPSAIDIIIWSTCLCPIHEYCVM